MEVERPGGVEEVISTLAAGSVFGEGVFIAGARRRQATVPSDSLPPILSL